MSNNEYLPAESSPNDVCSPGRSAVVPKMLLFFHITASKHHEAISKSNCSERDG